MSLRFKTVLILIFSLVATLSVLYVGLNRYIFNEFSAQELLSFDRVGEQIIKTIQSEEQHFSSFVRDWGVWTASFNFIEDLNQNYIDENLTIEALDIIGTACVLYFDSDFNLRYHYSPPENVVLAESVAKAVEENRQAIELLDLKQDPSFYLSVENIGSPFLVALHPVMTTDHTRLSNGYILMGVPVDEDFSRKISHDSGFDFSLQTKGLEHDNAIYKTDEISVALNFISDETALMVLKVRDIDKKFSFTLATEIYREMNVHLHDVLQLMIFMMIVVGLLGILLVVMLVNRLVLSPVLYQIFQFNQIGSSGDLNHRLIVQGSGELRLLSETANRMLDKVQGLNQEIRELSETDGLTGLWNRRRFDAQLRHEWLRAQRKQISISLLMIDIDYFKSVNDTYGHPTGDSYLRSIAKTIVDNLLREADFCARFGGEEFTVILPDVAPDGAMIVAERIRNAVADLQIENSAAAIVSKIVTVSIGIATLLSAADESHENLVIMADQALYSAKKAGRNCSKYADG
ncbi:MAG: diguanylate cyclase [Desulfobacterales bacterium]|nr:diguanylate cyclase [Desulfobacterales bacterium]